MQIYSQLAPLALGGAHGSAVAMGFFDGIHIGHRAVINGAVEWAKAHGAAPAVFTFRLPTENKMKGKRLLSTEDKHGMPYAIRFTVHHGAGLGRTLGVPTINQLYPQGFQLPRYGIYITRTRIGDRWYPSATGLGTRPTVNSDESKVTCETFIPGFTGDLYGTDPVVEFHAYLSPSKKFDTLDELRACIDHAAQRAQEYFAERTL